jgi:ABC-type microcin C transport system permease subunit YejE
LIALVHDQVAKIFQPHPYVPEVTKHSALDSQRPQCPSQYQPIKTAQMPNDILLVLLYKGLHGALLGVGLLAISNIIPRLAPFLYATISLMFFSYFGHSNLFRNSDFVLRIWLRLRRAVFSVPLW